MLKYLEVHLPRAWYGMEWKTIFPYSISSVARGSVRGSSPPHWPKKYAKSHLFGAFEADFCSKNENSPLKVFKSRSCEGVAVIRQEELCEFPITAEKSVSTFFFFGDHLFLGEKTV